VFHFQASEAKEWWWWFLGGKAGLGKGWDTACWSQPGCHCFEWCA